MNGHKTKPTVTVQRDFARTRLSDDLLAQAYEYVLRGDQQAAASQQTSAAPTTRSRKPTPRPAMTGGRTC